MAAGPIGAPPAHPPMPGGGADDSWANCRPYYGSQEAIGAPPATGGAADAADGQQDEWDWGPRWSWWWHSSHWWSNDRWWSRGN
eukprot:12030328-Alexandrium_andersonii.AAC.1